MLNKRFEFETEAWANQQAVLGIDEAGRGPLAGPLVVAGVILKPHTRSDFIVDSKTLSEKKRYQAFLEVLKHAQAYEIKIKSPQAIDASNIYALTLTTMQEIADILPADLILADAMQLQQPHSKKLIKGDQRSISIAAASILAKVVRDQLMLGYDAQYPVYGFKQHKGYPTKAHYEALALYGPCPIHRLSFKLFKQATLF